MARKLLFDFHTHVSSIEELEKYYEYDIIPVINCRTKNEYEKLKKAVEKFNKSVHHTDYDFYFSVGIHPNDSKLYVDEIEDVYSKIVKEAHLIGEVGMDALWCDVSFDIQEKVFTKSLDMANEYNKAVILHTKDMEKRILYIIEDYNMDFVVHWYSCKDYVHEYINKGCYFTIGPAILVDENVMYLAKHVPMDRLLLETDGLDAVEWLFKRTYASNRLRDILESVVEELAMIKGTNVDEMYEILEENSRRLLSK